MPASRKARLLAVLAACVVLVAGACSSDDPEPPAVAAPTPTPTPTPDPKCPLTGEDPADPALVSRPAVAVKVENHPVAYPLSGLEEAEIVFEELVEGGITRFMAIYHCTDAAKVGPVRSSRVIDPGIMIPITRILGAAGGNDIVRKELQKAKVVILDEDTSGEAMRRIPRAGISLEHTLYANTKALRKLGSRSFDEPPKVAFEFGPLEGDAKRARELTASFAGQATVSYRWKNGKWLRFDDGSPLLSEDGKQIAVDNVVIEQHTVRNSRTIVDVAGNPSIEIADDTGRGPAVLLRDGKQIKGSWIRKRAQGPVRFITKSGEPMVFAPGTIWVELLPDRKGEIKGSFSIR
ncbi:MAG: DUF3048 domain-containing protein [Actinomycetota bacterium]